METTVLGRLNNLSWSALLTAVSVTVLQSCYKVAECPPSPTSVEIGRPIVRRQAVESGMELRIEPAEERYCRGTCVRVALRMNGSKIPLWVNALLEPTFNPNDEGTVELHVHDSETGAERQPRCFTRPNSTSFDEYLLFTPGTEVSRVVSIDCYAFPEGTSWRVVAHYKDKNSSPASGQPAFSSWFTGELVSNEMLIMGRVPKRTVHVDDPVRNGSMSPTQKSN